MVGLDAVFGDVDVLRRGAHLAAVQRQREGQVVQHGAVLVGRFDDDAVHTSHLGVQARLAGVVLQPAAKLVAAGEVDAGHGGALGQGLGVGGVVGQRQGHQVGVQALFAQHVAHDADGDGGRQHGVGVGLDDDRVARGQGSEQAGVGVPGGEGGAANHQANATAHDVEVLLHHQRWVFALGLFPGGFGGHIGLGLVGVGNGFQGAVLRVRATGLEGHHRALAGGEHHGVGDFMRALVDASERFEQHAGAALRAQGCPGGFSGLGGGNQGVHAAFGVAHAHLYAVGGAFCGQATHFAWLLQGVVFAQQGFHSGLPIGLRSLAINFGRGIFWERRPVSARGAGGQGAVQQGAVGVEQAHEKSPIRVFPGMGLTCIRMHSQHIIYRPIGQLCI